MKKKKSKFLLPIIMGVAACLSCQKQYGEGAVSSGEIYFTTENVVVDMETKAFVEANSGSLQANGWRCAAVTGSGITMFDEELSYVSGVYKAGCAYYYPEQSNVSFYGVFPKSQPISVDGDAASLQYAQNADTDLVVAKALDVAKSDNAVLMDFSHILAQTRISCKGIDENVEYKLKSIKIYMPDGASYSYADESWGNHGPQTEYTLFSGSMDIATDNFTLAVQPCTFIPGFTRLNVSWECYNKGTTTLVGSYEQELEGKLEQGRNSHVKLSLPNSTGKAIRYETRISDWVEGDLVLKNAIKPLPGVFTVNSEGKKVRFAPGNLFWDGSDFGVEKKQYDYPQTRESSHIGHFFYSKDLSVAIAPSYNDPSASTSDVLFAADGGAIWGWDVLSDSEWRYLIDRHAPYQWKTSIDGVHCRVIVPDNLSGIHYVNGTTIKSSYTASEWKEAEAEGLVALPFAGMYSNGIISQHGNDGSGYLWTKSPDSDADKAWCGLFYNGNSTHYSYAKSQGHSIRLVKIVE